MLSNDKCIISKYHRNCFSCVVILARIIKLVAVYYYRILVEVVRCLVVRSTRRFHVLDGRSKAGVMLSSADLRRNISAGDHSTLHWLK